ncbi:MAG: ATP-binding protein [Bacteroidetes bacterium HGW-Bacteroidetes-4]|jgi:predicted HTH transcriptional regulator|nr:MAG: ATP-binding protein [Bacteroidetes bacterium HGW-Bacteroidetes-4]
MERNYIKNLIAQGEHLHLDFKFEISDARKIARSLVAFANTSGGRLLVGVKDNGVIAGVRSDEEIYMIETAAHIFCKPEVAFVANNHLVDGRTVVEVIVEKSTNLPHYAPGKDDKWTAYLRVHDENLVANKVQLKVWKRLSNQNGVYLKYTDAEKQLLSYIEAFGEVTFSKACRIAQTSKNKTENLLANLIAIGILEPVFKDQQISYGIKSVGNFNY